MSKQIYYATQSLIINGTLVGRRIIYRHWHYGEMPTERRKLYDDFDRFWDSPDIHNWNDIYFSTFLQRKIKSVFTEEIFTKKNFKKAEFVENFSKEDKNYSMKDLMERLSADDFIAYCKDHNLTICPMS